MGTNLSNRTHNLSASRSFSLSVISDKAGADSISLFLAGDGVDGTFSASLLYTGLLFLRKLYAFRGKKTGRISEANVIYEPRRLLIGELEE